jgi:hypothetical protein
LFTVPGPLLVGDDLMGISKDDRNAVYPPNDGWPSATNEFPHDKDFSESSTETGQETHPLVAMFEVAMAIPKERIIHQK